MDLANARALTVKQPWASLIATGAKTVENRTWPIPATWKPAGPLLIHAGMGTDRGAWERLMLRDDLAKHGIHGNLPHGAVLAVARTVSCHQARWGCCTNPYAEPDGWHWALDDVTRLAEPITATGHLGLWHPDEQLLAAAAKQLTKEA